MFYIFATSMESDKPSYGRASVWKSKDSVNWEMQLNNWPEYGKFGGDIWAPDIIKKDGKYYQFITRSGGYDTWIAVADSPTGPWKNLREDNTAIVSGGGNAGRIVSAYNMDAQPFIDDDGQAYLTWSNLKPAQCMIQKLKPNMIEFDGEPVEITGLDHFREGSWIHKKAGIYYLSYNAGGNDPMNGRICYAMSTTSPVSGYVFKGDLIRPTEEMQATAHHSIAKCGDRWVLAYHIRGPSRFERHTCLDYLHYNADGTIKQISPTLAGVNSACSE